METKRGFFVVVSKSTKFKKLTECKGLIGAVRNNEKGNLLALLGVFKMK